MVPADYLINLNHQEPKVLETVLVIQAVSSFLLLVFLLKRTIYLDLFVQIDKGTEIIIIMQHLLLYEVEIIKQVSNDSLIVYLPASIKLGRQRLINVFARLEDVNDVVEQTVFTTVFARNMGMETLEVKELVSTCRLLTKEITSLRWC